MRYFTPFDHQGPIYTYFIFLPVYLFPWTILFLPELFSLKSRFKNMPLYSKWLFLTLLVLFLFFTISGSRRNYYVLPLVPFAILFTADWILINTQNLKRSFAAASLTVIFFIAFFIDFSIVQPLYYLGGGTHQFVMDLKQEVNHIKPWSEWNIVMLDPESKVRFYLGLSPKTQSYEILSDERTRQTTRSLLSEWPFLHEANRRSDTIFISREQYANQLRHILKNYTLLEAKPGLGEKLRKQNPHLPVAFLPMDKKDSV